MTQSPLPLAAVRLLQCYPRIDQIATDSRPEVAAGCNNVPRHGANCAPAPPNQLVRRKSKGYHNACWTARRSAVLTSETEGLYTSPLGPASQVSREADAPRAQADAPSAHRARKIFARMTANF